MKRQLFTSLVGMLTLATVSFAQTGSVPAAAKSTFAKLYPSATGPKWDGEDGGYEASFKDKGKTMSLLFDAKGQLKETETDIAVLELPAAVRDYVAKQMPGKKIKEAAIIVDAAGVKKYEAEVGGKDLMFSVDGKLIK
ncbi:PepSY-like domain-containing protein [Spirosoma pollinicola]|uniref:Putative beta-lactamase-inhibitor-like PepSY-like domain-containing protein n=1 Tax=Spirosoma pollinicola TaxID=2057025 RepID=A0A2K8Z672_9BACT|nr:PepSY-like domain-containing protein [Spirosoma pollinicola]AUD05387.1 hypothetical protein CWM47_28155 [Spirosoma pollinicola]